MSVQYSDVLAGGIVPLPPAIPPCMLYRVKQIMGVFLDAWVCSPSRVSFGLEPASGRYTHHLRRDGSRSTTSPSTSTVTSGKRRISGRPPRQDCGR